MNWSLILSGSLTLGTLIAVFVFGYKYRKGIEAKNDLNQEIKDSAAVVDFAAKQQVRFVKHEKEIADISSGPATANGVARVLSRQVSTPDRKTNASGS